MTRSFTLLELLVAVLLLALIAGVGLVSLDGLTAKTRLETAGRSIEQAFQLARSEAISSGLPRRLLLDPQVHGVQLLRPHIGQEGLTWVQGPCLAWSQQVTLAFEPDTVTATQDDTKGQVVVSVWPDGTSPSCQFQLREGSQQVTVTFDGLNVTSQWPSAEQGNGKTSNPQ